VPLEPAVASWVARSIERFSGTSQGDIAQRRADMEASYNSFMAEYPADPAHRLAGVVARELSIPGAERDVPVRLLIPPGAGPLPVVIHFFGGAWWQRTFDAPDVVDACRQLALDGDAVVVQVDYALSPEQPYPAALDDAWTALLWAASGAADPQSRIDPTRLIAAGISAGANIAAALCLIARDRGGPRILSQVLEVPVLDLTLGHYDDSADDSLPDVAGAEAASREPLDEAVRYYLAGGGMRDDPYVSPLFAADLSGLPPALILTAEYDPLRIEGAEYAAALMAAGTPATVVRYGGLNHAAPSLSAISTGSRAWRAQVAAAVRHAGAGR
jgi:acetyl esterase